MSIALDSPPATMLEYFGYFFFFSTHKDMQMEIDISKINPNVIFWIIIKFWMSMLNPLRTLSAGLEFVLPCGCVCSKPSVFALILSRKPTYTLCCPIKVSFRSLLNFSESAEIFNRRLSCLVSWFVRSPRSNCINFFSSYCCLVRFWVMTTGAGATGTNSFFYSRMYVWAADKTEGFFPLAVSYL